jgi:hypothetical protein
MIGCQPSDFLGRLLPIIATIQVVGLLSTNAAFSLDIALMKEWLLRWWKFPLFPICGSSEHRSPRFRPGFGSTLVETW